LRCWTSSIIWYSEEHNVLETGTVFILIWKGGRMETYPVFETLCSSEYQTLDKVQKLSNPSVACYHHQNPSKSNCMDVVLMKMQFFE
jgi:hypothetical protein